MTGEGLSPRGVPGGVRMSQASGDWGGQRDPPIFKQGTTGSGKPKADATSGGKNLRFEGHGGIIGKTRGSLLKGQSATGSKYIQHEMWPAQ